MPTAKTFTRLALYGLTLVGLCFVLFASVGFLAGSLVAVAPTTVPKVEVQLVQDNVPLPPVITPEVPPLERVLTNRRPESSFATIGSPSQDSGTALGSPTGASDTFVTLGAPAERQPLSP